MVTVPHSHTTLAALSIREKSATRVITDIYTHAVVLFHVLAFSEILRVTGLLFYAPVFAIELEELLPPPPCAVEPRWQLVMFSGPQKER